MTELGLTSFDLSGMMASMPALKTCSLSFHSQHAVGMAPMDISNLKNTLACPLCTKFTLTV
jgi:hypothetical protein